MKNLITLQGQSLSTQLIVVGAALVVLALGILAVGGAAWVFASLLRAACAG